MNGDVDPSKLKRGVGKANGDDTELSEGQKMFKGQVSASAPKSRMEQLLEKGKTIAKSRTQEHIERMNAEGEAEEIRRGRQPNPRGGN